MTQHGLVRKRNSKLLYLSLSLSWIVLLLFPFGCQRASADRPKDTPEALLVVSDATAIQYTTLDGTQQVYYRVKICYPGKKVIDELSTGMLQKNWVLLNEDFLNPGLKSNNARGEWSTFWDAKGNYVYQWIADWKDSAGNIIRYGLRYVARDKESSTRNCNMDVYGTFFSKKILDETLSRSSPSGK